MGVTGGKTVVDERGLVGGRGFLEGGGGSICSESTMLDFDGLLGGRGRSLDGFLGGVGLFLTSGVAVVSWEKSIIQCQHFSVY